jgi:hypothetical protein
MTRQMAFRWDTVLEFAPHGLCVAASAALGPVLSDGGGAASGAPAWAKAVFWGAAIGLAPLCFAAGRWFRPWPRRWGNAALIVFNGVFAVLAGVTVAMLGVSVFFDEAVRWTGAAGPAGLLWGPLTLGGCLGLVGYVAGHSARRRRMVGV